MKDKSKELIDQLKNLSDLARGAENAGSSLGKEVNFEYMIDNYNSRIILAEEIQKKELREKLTKTVTAFIWIQIVFFNLVVLGIVVSVITDISWFKNVDKGLAEVLFEFLKYYISATIVELLGMLVFILHYVFSKFQRSNTIKSN